MTNKTIPEIIYGRFKALSDVGAERARQIRKGYDAAHDDADEAGMHARAAAFYATCGYWQRAWGWSENPCLTVDKAELDSIACQADVSLGYPWGDDTIRVEYSPRANLVKAAALLVAEIERIDRERENNDEN